MGEYELTKSVKSRITEITKVHYYPNRAVGYNVKREKGKKGWWKLLGIIPIFKYTSNANKYEYLDSLFYRSITVGSLEEITKLTPRPSYIEDNKVWEMGKVEVIFSNGDVYKKYFQDPKCAQEYIKEIEDAAFNVGITFEKDVIC